MGTTGLIFGAIAIAWLAYLVPHFVRKRDGETVAEGADPAERFASSMRVVQHGTAPLLDQDLAEIGNYEVSTPLTRRAAIADLRRLDSVAAVRRRRVLMVLLAGLSLLIGLAAVGVVSWWLTAIPVVLLALFVVLARFSVLAIRRSLDARHADILRGGDEVTVFINRAKLKAAVTEAPKVAEPAPVAAPIAAALWDPVPITVPTYVSKPLAPRTVRTIDLSGPAVTSGASVQHPVTADAEPINTDLAGSLVGVGDSESSRFERRAASA